MSARDLGKRLGRLESGRDVPDGEPIDLATLTDQQREVVARLPWRLNGSLDYAAMNDADLRTLASILV